MSPTTLPAGAPRPGLFPLALGSIGVVYGDIGTSPLYALKEAVKAAGGGEAPLPDMVTGVVSLILWTLMVIVTLKYVFLIMRADNNGEGGILALTALAASRLGPIPLVVGLGMVGAALFYGDAVLTPAVSVLSAVEGLKLVAPALDPYIIPIALVVLIGLFAVQWLGTEKVAKAFGPIMAAWFGVIALAGLYHILQHPSIMAAVNPLNGLSFLIDHPSSAFITLGAVFLSVTGAEALYADMGHFGRTPIQVAWLGFVFPALALNYLGQGALILGEPETFDNPFYLLFPSWMLLPVVLLATMATVIAAQAVISGAFSLTQQAILLKVLPRLQVLQTSENERGQIYVPKVNWLLLAIIIPLVLTFRTSDSLASAYGIAVTGTMVVTAILAFTIAWKHWGWNPIVAGIVVAPLLVIDLIFLASNALKIVEGGWLPLAFGATMVLIMWTWRTGIKVIERKQSRDRVMLADFLGSMEKSSVARVKGTAIFLTSILDEVPPALGHNLKHNRVLHENNVILHVHIEPVPRVSDADRVAVEVMRPGWTKVTMNFGFMETPNVTKTLAIARKHGLKYEVAMTSFFLSRLSIKADGRSGMPMWQDKLFIWMSSYKTDASTHFHIPVHRAIEIGTQITV